MKNDNIKNCILSVAQMSAVDEIAITGLKEQGRSGADLMEEAGISVVRQITRDCQGTKALILCGPGNNGGDGFVIARHMVNCGWQVDLALLGDRKKLSGDASRMAGLWKGEIKKFEVDLVQKQDVIIDAVFGTGLSKEITGVVYDIMEKANNADAYRVAVDIPSGIGGDTGEIMGIAFKADMTVTFCRKKPAQLLCPGKIFCGDVVVADIGISDRIVKEVKPEIFLNRPQNWICAMPRMMMDGHKYDRGHAVIVSGGMTHTGASRLAANAALRMGAGLVSVSSPEDALGIHAAHLTAVMIRQRENLQTDLADERMNSWCIGPAAGVNIQTRREVLQILKAGKHAVLDADALSVFEDGPLELFEAINARERGGCVLTPHGGEFHRLFPYLRKLDKITASRNAAKLSGATVVYKGADTVIAAPDGRVCVTDNAPSTLATAGSGDVLAGMVCGLLAQNMDSFNAACAAVWIHGECANEFGEGLISEDLIGLISRVLKRLKPPIKGVVRP